MDIAIQEQPTAWSPRGSAARPPEDAPRPPALLRRILIIDDEATIREVIRRALSQTGCEVFEADNGERGIEVARTRAPELILCDVWMERMDGYATLAALRREPQLAAIPFILMTGQADTAGMRQGMTLGADDYLPKPFTMSELLDAVEAQRRKQALVREQTERRLAELRANISLALPHELITPLNGILAYAEILRLDSNTLPAKEIAEMANVICESATTLHRLIENYLVYAQIELLANDPQKLAALRGACTPRIAESIACTAQARARTLNRPADLVLDLCDGAVALSPDYLQKITDELVQNAFKFSPAGTPVTVQTVAAPSALLLIISDHGRGMTAEQIARTGAYLQFQRKFHEQSGVGLGLSIARRLVEIHGGSLAIHSATGEGTTVTARLPQARPAA